MLRSNRSSISVIIPARNAAADLGACLSALVNGNLVPDEIVVIDDGSTDSTGAVAKAYGAGVVSVNGGRGAAYPRNVGVRHSSGDLLVFIDADVVVHRDTIRMFSEQFERDSDVAAVMGSYDATPTCTELLSQYRNLMHHYTHQKGSRTATTFWTGCGAVRRNAFEHVGGFDERYRAMEDIDLGRRLSAAGYKIELNPTIQATHRKRWTFRKMVLTDIFHRGIPWTLTILRDGSGIPNELNLKWTQRLCVAGVYALILLAVYTAFRHGGRFLTPLFGCALLVTGTYWTRQSLGSPAWAVRACLALLLSTHAALSYWLGDIVGPSLVIGGYVFLFLRHICLAGNERAQRATGLLYGCFLVAALAYFMTTMPAQHEVFLFWLLGIAVVGLNLPFYLFLCRRLGKLCGLSTVPFHMMYHLYGGISFGIGLLQHWMEKRKYGELPVRTRGKCNEAVVDRTRCNGVGSRPAVGE